MTLITNNGRLEMSKSSNLSMINWLESEVKSLEFSVVTLENFVFELAYIHSYTYRYNVTNKHELKSTFSINFI